jgi:hypothetical protein
MSSTRVMIERCIEIASPAFAVAGFLCLAQAITIYLTSTDASVSKGFVLTAREKRYG